MLTDEHVFRPDKRTSHASCNVPIETSAEFVQRYNGQAHEAIDAIASVVIGAEASLNWMRVQPPDLKELREVLDSIANNAKRAAEIVVRLQGLVKEAPKADGATGSLSGSSK